MSRQTARQNRLRQVISRKSVGKQDRRIALSARFKQFVEAFFASALRQEPTLMAEESIGLPQRGRF
jgi:hypothetical protein